MRRLYAALTQQSNAERPDWLNQIALTGARWIRAALLQRIVKRSLIGSPTIS